MNMLLRFLKAESGATAIEYGLIAFAICMAILAAVQLVGGQLFNLFTALTNGVGAVQP